MPAYRGDDPFADFQRELDESGRLSDDPFGTEIGGLDDEDLELLGYGRNRVRKAPAAKPAKKGK
jgi:hypothetical protein